MPVLSAIGVLALLIFVHELGHFLSARWQNIHVTRFSIGFGPALLQYQGKQTLYALRLFPLGGYVAFPDDDPDSTIPPDDPNLLRNRPLVDRAIVISAGVIANLIFAYFLLVSQSLTIGFPDFNYAVGVKIPQVSTEGNAIAYHSGIQSNDVILSVNGQDLPTGETALTTLRNIIQASPDQDLTFVVQRNQETLRITVTPELGKDGQGKIGVLLSPNGDSIRIRSNNVFQALQLGGKEFERILKLTLQGFGQLIHNFSETAEQVAGPVAIVAVGAKLAQDNLGNLFQFGALISINLAIMNILPLPALDGGQLAFLLVEGMRGKPVPQKLQDGIMQTGLVLLLSLGVLLIVRDTANLTFFKQLFQ